MADKVRSFLRRRLHILQEAQALKRLPPALCNSESLRRLTETHLAEIFGCARTAQEWTDTEADLIQACQIEDGKTGGVNPGDRRAVWHLIEGFGATSVLEIGTHVGASTLHIAAALRSMARRDPSIQPRLVTVDIQDVNSEVSGYWKQYGLMGSPRKMIEAIACSDFVRFVTQSSLAFLDNCQEQFDLVFLDGDHAATTVYQELPRALRVLRKDGVILLHDYFPGNRPLWSSGSLVPGPYIAVSRLRREGTPVEVIPLGDLPWQTKEGSRKTSLALVTRGH